MFIRARKMAVVSLSVWFGQHSERILQTHGAVHLSYLNSTVSRRFSFSTIHTFRRFPCFYDSTTLLDSMILPLLLDSSFFFFLRLS